MRYTSDMTDSQWEIIKPILQGAKYKSLEEKREQINAVFYLVKTGYQCMWISTNLFLKFFSFEKNA